VNYSGHVKEALRVLIKTAQESLKLLMAGTIFLDEIGDMSLNAQANYCSTSENKIQQGGSDKDIKVNVRILAATNKI
jgi:transcriptional regulator with GAF, ATPase, and Fis domain